MTTSPVSTSKLEAVKAPFPRISYDDAAKMLKEKGLEDVLMVVGGIVEIFLGVKAEGESLEDIATPLTAGGAITVKAR